jgi:hypothetical protein
MKQLICLLGVLIAVSCTERTKSKDERRMRDDSIPVTSTKRSQRLRDTASHEAKAKVKFTTPFDTFTSLGNEIVFFRPAEEEFELLAAHYGEDSGIRETEADFSFYAQSVSDSLKTGGTKVVVPKQRIIKIVAYDGTVSYLDRLDNGTNEFGIIFNYSDTEPVVAFGVDTDVSILERIKKKE